MTPLSREKVLQLAKDAKCYGHYFNGHTLERFEQFASLIRAEALEEAAIRGRIAQLEGKLVDVEILALKGGSHE